MKNNTKGIFKYVIEFLIVAFGVFLGMYVSDWQSNRKLEAKKDKSIAYIQNELEINQINLLKRIEYHEKIKVGFDSIRATLTNDDMLAFYYSNTSFRHQQIPGWTGIRLPSFEDVAFEGAKISGIIQEYDLELTQEISRIYKQQQFISELGKSILENMIDIDSNSKTADVISIIELLTMDFVNGERGLYNQYNEAIAKVKKM
ncbi:hypothetical protein [Psychroserpens sp.]|uniref:hypothetical protein n=1 Tax=Psychroserpens sp. TaxID=2020870 RepID=UPI003858055C